MKEITSKCDGKSDTETACLQIAREDGTPILFTNIIDDLQCSNGTFNSPKYLPYPSISSQKFAQKIAQNEFLNIVNVSCSDYENSIPSDFKTYGFLSTDLCIRLGIL